MNTQSQLQLAGAILTGQLDSGAAGGWTAASGGESQPKGASYKSGVFTIGWTHPVTKHFFVGAASGYAHTWSSSLAVNSGYGALYAAYYTHGWYAYEAVLGGGQRFTATRNGILGSAEGEGKGFSFGQLTSTGYNWTLGPWKTGPFATLSYSLSTTGAFTETDALPLHIESNTNQSISTELGWKNTLKLKRVSINADFAWIHEYAKSAVPSVVSIVGLPASSTTVFGPALSHDGMVIDAGLSFQLSKALSIGTSYHGELLRQNYKANAVIASLKLEF
jgi:outer membrane autotransporter protein